MIRITRGAFVTAAIVALVAFALPGSGQVDPNQVTTELYGGHRVVAGEVLIKFLARVPPPDLEQDADADRVQEIGGVGVRRVHSRSLNTTALIARFAHRGDLEYVEPNYIVHAGLTPDDTYFNLLWGLFNTGQTIGGQVGVAGADISAVDAWDVSTGSRANVVGVVDTGIYYTHPDLSANVWSAPSSFSVKIGSTTINCAAGTHGFNAITSSCDPLDDNDHGTHVSGTIGALGNNGIGVAGVNWTASIMGLKFLNRNGSGSTSDAVNAIEFAIQAKTAGVANVRVLSNSWGGGGFTQTLLDEINKANTNDMLFVAAAGNNGRDNDTTANYPSNYNAPNVVAVAATDNRDALASFSNYGATTVDLGAPGVYIASTIRNNGYAYMSGTSMATPHVSGAAALVLSKCALNTAGLKTNLLNAIDTVASLAGKTLTGGRLNVATAINSCGTAPAPDFTLSASPGSVTVAQGAQAAYTVTVGSLNGFAGTVGLAATGLPSGASATFNPPSVSGSGTSAMTVSTSSTTPTGTYTVTITGTSGALVHTTTVTLVVNPQAQPDFTISASPSSLNIKRPASGSSTITVSATGGFSGTVGLTVSTSGNTGGASVSVSPTTITGSGTATLTVKPGSAAARFTVTITGTSGSLVHSTTVSVRIR